VLCRTAWPLDVKGLLVDSEISESSFQDAFETGLKLDSAVWAPLRKPRNGSNEIIMMNTKENLRGSNEIHQG